MDLEIQGGSVNASRLEQALQQAGFAPDTVRIWRWKDRAVPGSVVKVEFLADFDDIANYQTVSFDGCESLGAINLRGTGFASEDWQLRSMTAEIDGQMTTVELRVPTLPAYLLAKIHAAHGRGLPKDWHDIAYVLLHNDDGGPVAAARRVHERFGGSGERVYRGVARERLMTDIVQRTTENAAAGGPPWLGPEERDLVARLAGA